MQERLSSAVSWLRFTLIFFIIMLHCYSAVRLEGSYDTYFKILYPFSLWLGETGVPGFFFISGFLFFYSRKPYGRKIATRMRTLLVPYVLWNALLLALYLAAYFAGFQPEINGKPLAGYGVVDYLRVFWDRGSYDNGNFVPLLCPLWYIRNLLIMCVLSPLFYYLIRYVRELFLIALLGWWLSVYDNAFIPQTVFFFCLGGYFSIFGLNPLDVFRRHRVPALALFAIQAVADIAVHTLFPTPANLQIHRLSLLLNIPVLFLVADACARRGYSSRMLSQSAFIVFCVHYPLVIVTRRLCVMLFAGASNLTHILLYFASILVVTAASLAFCLILDRYAPGLKNLLSGNR